MKKFYRPPDGSQVVVSVLEDVELSGSHFAVIASPGLVGTASLEMEDADQDVVTHGLLIVEWEKLFENEQPPPGKVGSIGRGRLASILGQHR